MVTLIVSENCRKYLGISFIPSQHSDFKFQTWRASFYTLFLSNFDKQSKIILKIQNLTVPCCHSEVNIDDTAWWGSQLVVAR